MQKIIIGLSSVLLLLACGGGEEESKIVPDDCFVEIPAGSWTLTHSTVNHAKGETVQMNAFALGKTPVTVAQFKKCVSAGACSRPKINSGNNVAWKEYCNYTRGETKKNHPMNCIDFAGAQEYCEWVGGRLPTEEEWEYAATHNGIEHLNTKYAFGDTLEHCVNAQYLSWASSEALYCQGDKAEPMPSFNREDGTSDVGIHSPAGDSPLGLVDMTGNVGEWTSSSNTDMNYIVKGGSWDNTEAMMSVASRNHSRRDIKGSNGGFRCAK